MVGRKKVNAKEQKGLNKASTVWYFGARQVNGAGPQKGGK